MTPHTLNDDDSGASDGEPSLPAGAPEITPAMIEAGIRIIERDFGSLRDPLLRLEHGDLVCSVYTAMRRIADAV